MKIFFVGDLNDYTRTHQRYASLVSLGFEVFGASTMPIPWLARINKPSIISRIFWRLGFPLDANNANKQIKQLLRNKVPDVVWIEQGVTIKPSTLWLIKSIAPSAKLISLGEDDMYARHNRSFYYMRGLKYYDIVFTTKTYNLDELKALGARRTELFLDAYNEEVHRPFELGEEEKKIYSSDVGFAGSFEADRAEMMLYLAENGIKVTVWGNDWEPWDRKHPNLIIKSRHLFGTDYAKAISGTKINLCFLRKLNRDLVTSRTVEIPACGGFMLGERTWRQLEFFEEGKEAEFFGSKEEMLEKTKYYLEHEEERRRIALAGRERCLKSGYGMKEQLSRVIETIIG